MLGWRILGDGEYRLDLPHLSAEEEELIALASEKFREAAREGGGDRARLIEGLVLRAAEEKGVYLDRRQQAFLGSMAAMHIYGFGFLEPLLSDREIEEISVIGPGKPAYVYLRKKGWKAVNAAFDDERAIAEMVNRMASRMGRRITLQNPRLDAILPDGSRLHASLPPVSIGEITIRRFREKPLSPAALSSGGTVSSEALAFLSVLMQSDASIVVSGNTASGKTTTLNALFCFVPGDERIIIAEETPEIMVPHPHQMRMVANRDMGIGLKDLVYDTLRMRPDRMIVGEVRSRDEAGALFDVLLAGQARGCYATFHAQSAAETHARLRHLGIQGDDLSSIDCIVVQRRMLQYEPGKRRCAEIRRIVEIAELGPGGELCPVYLPGSRLRHGTLFKKAAESFGLDERRMNKELGMRERMIRGAPEDCQGFFEEIQRGLYGGSDD